MMITLRMMTVMAMTILVILAPAMICFDTGWFSYGNGNTGNYGILIIISNDGMAMICFNPGWFTDGSIWLGNHT